MPEERDETARSSARIRIAPAASRPAGRESLAAAAVEDLLARLETTTGPAERARLLVDVAVALRDELGDTSQAIDALVEAFACDPTYEPILDHAEPLLRASGRFPEIVATATALFGKEPDGRRALAYAEAIVRWYSRETVDPAAARAWVERVRVLDSTHSLVHLLQAAVARELGDHRREIDELDRAVLSAKRADDRARIHLLMAARYREPRLANRAEAKKHYAAAHKLFAADMDALRGLEAIAIEEKDGVGLADVLRRQTLATIDAPAKLEVLLRLAAMEETEFRRPELAARTLEGVLAIAPEHAVAHEAIERCLRAARMWPELAKVLERSAVVEKDPVLRAAKLSGLGDVLESKLGDVRAALASYQRLAVVLPDDETIAAELARLAEKTGATSLAVASRERLAALAVDPIVRGRHYLVAGQLLVPTDPAAARKLFERAAEADPANGAAWNALLWDARSEGNASEAARYLEAKAKGTETARARAAAFVELAEHHARTGDRAAERAAYEHALEADPTNESAAGALLDAFVADRRFAEALPLATIVLHAADRDRDTSRAYAVRRAQIAIARAMDEPELALTAASAAYELRRTETEAREMLVVAASAMRTDPKVEGVREALVAIADDADALAKDARLALAETLAAIGEGDRAAVLFDEAMAADPNDERALAGLARHHAATGNAGESLELRHTIARNVEDEESRVAALLEVGAAAVTAEKNALAAEAYEEARAIRPRDLPILHKLLALYQQAERWVSVFDVLRSIADVDADPLRRAKTLFAMGQIAAAELMDRGTALELFDRSLDVDASRLEAFERIVRILTETKDWLGLEEMYKRMIARSLTTDDTTLKVALYKQVGVLYRDRIGDPARATQAFRAAIHLAPKDDEAQAMIREVLAKTGQSSGAVSITLDRVLRDPLDPRPYPSLFDLLAAQSGGRDRAYCVASAMRFLDVVHPGATGLLTSYPQPPLEGIVMDLGPEGYRALLHSELDPVLTEIFEIVAPSVIELTIARLSLRERIGHPGPAFKEDPALPKNVTRAATLLGAPAPKTYLRKSPGPPLGPAQTRPPGLLVHPAGLAGLPGEVVTFLIGKRVAELSPPLLARALCPSVSELKALASSAARIATDLTEPGDLALRERIGRPEILRIAEIVAQAKATSGGKLDVHRWSELADVSASRAGLLLSGDLEAARAAIAIEPQAPGDLSPRDKMRELVAWFLGESSAALRVRLGIALS